MDIDTFGLQIMNRLRLVYDSLQCYSVSHKFVVNDGLFLISRIIGPQVPASTEGEVLGEFVMSFDFGRSFVDRATQGVVHDPFQQIRCAYRVS